MNPAASEPRASTARLQTRLDEGLHEAALEARRTAREASSSSQDALAALLEGANLVERFLADLREAIGQIFVAGLAFPDPELPDELGELALRAQRLALVTPVRSCLRLRSILGVLADERDQSARHGLAQSAWHETQQLVAWLRLFCREHDLNLVQARLSASSAERAEQPARDLHTQTVSVWPLGLELSTRGRAVIHALALDGEREVVLLDELTELDAVDPVHRRVISRLFQSDVTLGQVMTSVIRLEDHPCVERGDVLVFRPAFTARPQLRPVAASFAPPRARALVEIAQAPTETGDAAVPGTTASPARVSARVRRQGRLVRLLPTHATAALQSTPQLDFNLTKLLVREAVPTVDLELTVLAATEPLAIIALETELDGRAFATVDPTAFALDAHVLARRALNDPLEATSLAGFWLRTAAVLYGGATEPDVVQLRAIATKTAWRGLAEAFRAGFACRTLAHSPPEPRTESLLRDALALAALERDQEPDLEALARVLGEDIASPADRQRIDGTLVLAAVWLAIDAGLVEVLHDALQKVFESRYAAPMQDPVIGDVCARALLMALPGIAAVPSATTHNDDRDGHDADDADDADDTDDTDDDGEDLLVTERGVELRTPHALAYLDAHIAELAERTRKRRGPLPPLIELLALGDVRALIAATPRHVATLAALGLAHERLRSVCADALLAWTFDMRADPATRLGAGDALFAILAAAMRPWFVS